MYVIIIILRIIVSFCLIFFLKSIQIISNSDVRSLDNLGYTVLHLTDNVRTCLPISAKYGEYPFILIMFAICFWLFSANNDKCKIGLMLQNLPQPSSMNEVERDNIRHSCLVHTVTHNVNQTMKALLYLQL